MKRIFLLLLFACAFLSAKGQVTYLDSSFNATGILSLNQAGGADIPTAVLTRPNGKSLAIGYSYFDTRTPASTLTTVTVVQFDTDGKPDPAFGQNGVVVLDQLRTDASAADAVLQPDGKLLITGRYLNSTFGPHHFVVRLKEDGSFDAGFGTNGVVGHPDIDLVAWGNALAVQPDGKIVMVGSKFTFEPVGGGYTELAMIRFHSDGLVDSSFGNNGVVVGDFSSYALTVAIDSDGLIYVSGYQKLARYMPSGDLDFSFGAGGLVQIPDYGGVGHIIVQPNGQIVVAGAEKGSYVKGFVRRLSTDGSFDPGFESPAIQNEEWLMDVVAMPDGKIMVGTYSPYFQLRVFRYLPNGQLDMSYDKEMPRQLKSFYETGLSLQPDGKIIVGGEYLDAFGFHDICLLRVTELLEADSLYGQNGLAVQNFGTSRSNAASILIDDQNRILVGGEATYTDGTTIFNLPIVHSIGFASRFQSNGTPDTSFWENGFKGLSFSPFIMNLLAQQPDGKIISAGGTNKEGGGIGVYRMLPDGSSDSDFGPPFNNGLSYQDLYVFDIVEAYASAVALRPDGAIVVTSEAVGLNGQHKIAIAQFDPSGLPDLSFGVDGVALTTGILIPGDFDLNAGLIQPDGKILVGGTYGSLPNIFLVRFMPDGTLDNSFGTGGRVLKPFTGVAYYLNALALQADGHILLAGNQGAAISSNLIVGRLNPDGTRDNTFSDDGLVVINTGTVESGHALAVQADGKIVVAGVNAISTDATANNPMFARFLADGSLDSSFAGTGYVVTNLPGDNQLKAMVVQSDGSYITAGYSNNDYLLIRYLSKLNVGLLEAANLQSEVLVYPNPVQGHATFTYTLSAASKVSLELFDMQGKLCHRFLLEESRPQGEQTASIYFPPSLIPGVYILRVRTEVGSKSVRVVVAG